MGNLPAARVNSSPPFYVTGVDYAGPILIRDRKTRGCKLIKGYICLFVCFATKTIHIELVTELSKEVFLLALKRFVARRGKPKHIFSDNGTNFVAASSELKQIYKFLADNLSSLSDALSKDNIEWSLNPPYSPHFGGLWESGVRIIKHHLRRVLGNVHLTYEELNSLLIQIEEIVNSRTFLSSDPKDLSHITPAHFLVGRALTSVPDYDYRSIPMNRLLRYQLTQRLAQHVWERWNKEYVSDLQKKVKWFSSKVQISAKVS